MFSNLKGLRVFLASLLCCIPSSAMVHLLIVWLVKIRPPGTLVAPVQSILFVLATGAFIGLLKSLPVSAVAYLVEPSLRWRLIVGITAALSLVEAWVYYELWTWTFPFG